MKKALFSALAVSTLFALFGCNNRSETQVLQPSQNEALKPMQQSWRGVLPCAGGVLDQPARLMAGIRIYRNALVHCRNRLAEGHARAQEACNVV